MKYLGSWKRTKYDEENFKEDILNSQSRIYQWEKREKENWYGMEILFHFIRSFRNGIDR